MNEVIAIIPVIGGIVDGVNSDSPLPLPVPIPLPLVDEQQTGDISIIQTIRNVLKDPTVVGTILFVDSPGGSVFASETIRSALMNLKKKMPLVAYFNSVSASGGYYISTPAQWIVSEPGAITGSIGVFNAKISMKGFIEKQQLNVETIKEGLRADWGNLYEPLSEEERNSSKELVDYHYQHFLSIVAENRNKSVEEIKDFAGGRVYLGTQAIENGLVDELGSLNKAKEKVCELAKKKASKIPLITFHPPKKMIAPLFVKNEKEFINKLVSKYNPYLKSNYWFRDFSMDYK
jgi:protease-4